MNQATTNNSKISLKSRVRYRSIGEDGVLVHLDSGRVIVVSDADSGARPVRLSRRFQAISRYIFRVLKTGFGKVLSGKPLST